MKAQYGKSSYKYAQGAVLAKVFIAGPQLLTEKRS